MGQHYHFNCVSDYILCRWCGADLAHPESIINVLSPFASSVKNISAFGFHDVLQQNLENPFGITFDIVTVSKSVCYEKLNHVSRARLEVQRLCATV